MQGDDRSFSAVDQAEVAWTAIYPANGSWRREEGISSEHEDFLNDIALFRATGAESAALFLCVFDIGALRRVWIDIFRHHLRTQSQGPGCRAAL
jgi:hypothetical protein